MSVTVTLIGKTSPSGSVSTIALPSYNQAAGNCIVVAAGLYQATVTGVTDTAGNTYVKAVSQLYSLTSTEIWYAKNCLGNASNVISIATTGTGGYSGAFGWDVAGVDKISPLDVAQTNGGTSATPTVTISTTAAAEAVIFFNAVVSGYDTGSAGTNYTSDGNVGQGGDEYYGQHRVTSSTLSSEAQTCSLTGSTVWGTVIASFKAAPTAAGSVIQSAKGTGTNAATATFNSPVAAGNALAAFVISYTHTGNPTISDSVNGAWGAPLYTDRNTSDDSELSVFLFANTAAGTPVVSMSVPGGAIAGLIALEVILPAATSADVRVTGGNQNTANWSAGAMATNVADVIFGYGGSIQGSGVSITPLNSFVLEDHTTTTCELFVQSLLAPSPSSYTAAATMGANIGSGTMSAVAFTTSSTYSISGSAGVAGATVSYSGTASGSVTADGSGNYTISGLANGSYTITPTKTGYTFSPANSAQTVAGANITGVNFTATQIVVATPTFSPVAGVYSSTQSVTISSTDSGLAGFAMYYTTDGSTPTTGSTLYTGPVTVSSSLTLKAIAVATSYANSNVGSAAYTINSSSGGTGSWLFEQTSIEEISRSHNRK